MKCFAGIDIGSTNIKLVLVNEEGEVYYTTSFTTPYVQKTLKYFDLLAIDRIVDELMKQAKSIGNLVSVAFSSVGESVVPVRNGKAIGNPLYHGENRATSNTNERKIISRYSSYDKTGIISSGLLSLDKILWFYRNSLERPDCFLPISSYQVYRKTGCTAWCYSQASRSNAYMVSEKNWNTGLLEAIGIESPGELGPTGMFCGEKEGIIYGLGGHDHITGLYGLYCITTSSELILDSMGTSSMVALLTNKPFTISSTYNPLGGGVVNGFKEDQYIVFRGLHLYGAIPAFWMNAFKCESTDENFDRINQQIMENEEAPLAFTMRVGGNYYNDGRLERGQIEYMYIDRDVGIDRYIESAYAYNILKTVQLVKTIDFLSDDPAVPYYSSGASISNDLFMNIKTTALNRQNICPNIKEISALGAACAGIQASGELEVFDQMYERTDKNKKIFPDQKFSNYVHKAISSYKNLDF